MIEPVNQPDSEDVALSPAQSPLAEPDPASLDELMQRDPLELTEQDLTTLVKYFRQNRERWLLEEKVKQSKPKAIRGAKAPKTKTPPTTLSLDEADLLLLESL